MGGAIGPTLGIILAGGLSRRMGGGDKGLARLGGVSIIEHVVKRIEPQVDCLMLNANGEASRFSALGLPILPDTLPGFPGPLAGVLAGLERGLAAGLGHMLTIPCDAPFLPRDLLPRLREAAREGGAVAVSAKRRHPTVALWPTSLCAPLRRALVEEDERRAGAFLRRHGFVEVEWPAEPFDPFLNVNDPRDLSHARATLQQWPDALSGK